MSLQTCLLRKAASKPIPDGAFPVYPGGQGSQRKPGLKGMQRTFESHGLNLHWRNNIN